MQLRTRSLFRWLQRAKPEPVKRAEPFALRANEEPQPEVHITFRELRPLVITVFAIILGTIVDQLVARWR